MTNQVNKEFEKWLKANYPDYPPPLSEVWQAATQAGESKINSLKQRVHYVEARALEESNKYVDYCNLAEEKIAEITKSNNQLREALKYYAEGEPAKMVARGHLATDIIMEYDCGTAINALSSTPAQSLAERDNEVIEKPAPCKHIKKIAEWDHVRCEDCGGVHPDSQHGSASHQWFKSWDEVKHYRTTGQRFPETA